ncbi:phosphoribosyl-ATP pyrophosphatase [Clostridiales bacterium PH28_bin88]|nr:phosphoribosyl-ATP pyrophosphatase [Clostridiales bacterium PH28_bin88]
MLDSFRYDDRGLIPGIVQDAGTGEVLMLAYMNRESLKRSLETGQTWFYSRSRQELWHKGATSGHVQHIRQVYYDCDADTLLVLVEQEGVACHEGERSCFHYRLNGAGEREQVEGGPLGAGLKENSLSEILTELFQVIRQRQAERPEGSYTSYLFNSGQDKILKKVGEESAEVVIASKNNKREEIIYEMADLMYHNLVLLAYHGLTIKDIAQELKRRR